MLGSDLHLRVPSRCASKRGALAGPRISPALHLSGGVFRETRLKVALTLQKGPLCEVPVSGMFQPCKRQPSARSVRTLLPTGLPTEGRRGQGRKVRSRRRASLRAGYDAVNAGSHGKRRRRAARKMRHAVVVRWQSRGDLPGHATSRWIRTGGRSPAREAWCAPRPLSTDRCRRRRVPAFRPARLPLSPRG